MKGLSPVISIVLLVLIAVALVLTVAMFMGNIVGSAKVSVEKKTTKAIGAASEALNIRSGWCNSSTNTLHLYVDNVGDITVQASSVKAYFKGRPLTTNVVGGDIAPGAQNVEITVSVSNCSDLVGKTLELTYGSGKKIPFVLEATNIHS
jgi:flagellin-like protein